MSTPVSYAGGLIRHHKYTGFPGKTRVSKMVFWGTMPFRCNPVPSTPLHPKSIQDIPFSHSRPVTTSTRHAEPIPLASAFHSDPLMSLHCLNNPFSLAHSILNEPFPCSAFRFDAILYFPFFILLQPKTYLSDTDHR